MTNWILFFQLCNHNISLCWLFFVAFFKRIPVHTSLYIIYSSQSIITKTVHSLYLCVRWYIWLLGAHPKPAPYASILYALGLSVCIVCFFSCIRKESAMISFILLDVWMDVFFYRKTAIFISARKPFPSPLQYNNTTHKSHHNEKWQDCNVSHFYLHLRIIFEHVQKFGFCIFIVLIELKFSQFVFLSFF